MSSLCEGITVVARFMENVGCTTLSWGYQP